MTPPKKIHSPSARNATEDRTALECAYTLCTRPIIRKVASIDEPPQERNGSVRPTTGSIASVMPMFSRICATNIAPTPAQIRPP